jgi:hypothetical protein
MADGWIKVYRKITETDGYFSEPFCRNMAWIDLLLLANHEDNFFRVRGVRVDVKRGQCGHAEDSLAKRWKWSRGKVRRFLNDLENDKKIVQQKSRVINLVTIVKYEEYQSNGTTKRTTNSTSNGQQTDTNKNVKNDKKGVEPRTPEQEKEFEKFQNWVKEKSPRVSEMREPFTIDQFFHIKAKFPVAEISRVLLDMHNWEPLVKKNRSAYLTCNKWLNREKSQKPFKPDSNAASAPLQKLVSP